MIIGVFGQMNNGKSTFARMLKKHLAARITNVFNITGFASAVKESVCNKFLISLEIIETWKNKPENYPGWNYTMRDVLQLEGQQARDIYPNVWVDKIKYKTGNIIVDDGRYQNELEMIKEQKGFSVLIYRKDFINHSNHESESFIRKLVLQYTGLYGVYAPELSMIDKVIENNGSLEDLSVTAELTANYIHTNWSKFNHA